MHSGLMAGAAMPLLLHHADGHAVLLGSIIGAHRGSLVVYSDAPGVDACGLKGCRYILGALPRQLHVVDLASCLLVSVARHGDPRVRGGLQNRRKLDDLRALAVQKLALVEPEEHVVAHGLERCRLDDGGGHGAPGCGLCGTGLRLGRGNRINGLGGLSHWLRSCGGILIAAPLLLQADLEREAGSGAQLPVHGAGFLRVEAVAQEVAVQLDVEVDCVCQAHAHPHAEAAHQRPTGNTLLPSQR